MRFRRAIRYNFNASEAGFHDDARADHRSGARSTMKSRFLRPVDRYGTPPPNAAVPAWAARRA